MAGEVVTNPSGVGLLSKGHPLGRTAGAVHELFKGRARRGGGVGRVEGVRLSRCNNSPMARRVRDVTRCIAPPGRAQEHACVYRVAGHRDQHLRAVLDRNGGFRGIWRRQGRPRCAKARRRGVPMRVFRELAAAAGDEVVESLSAFAQPLGGTVRAVYERLRDDILDDLAAAERNRPSCSLAWHGAMGRRRRCGRLARATILGRVRALAPAAAIGAVLDLHCHIDRKDVDRSRRRDHPGQGISAHRFWRAGRRALRHLPVHGAGEAAPVAAMVDTRMIELLSDLRSADEGGGRRAAGGRGTSLASSPPASAMASPGGT